MSKFIKMACTLMLGLFLAMPVYAESYGNGSNGNGDNGGFGSSGFGGEGFSGGEGFGGGGADMLREERELISMSDENGVMNDNDSPRVRDIPMEPTAAGDRSECSFNDERCEQPWDRSLIEGRQ